MTSSDQDNIKTKIEQRAGDRALQIGQVFGGVVFQFFSTRAVVVILVTLILGAITLFYAYSESQKPTRMTGDFNIAVAQFGEVTDQGIVPSARGRQISKLLFDFLDSQYKATDFKLNVQIAHDKLGILTEAREAEKLAADINADIVIYGSVFVDGGVATLSPRFYIRNRPDTSELTGQHRLALPLQFDISMLGFQSEINFQLRQRASVLVYFTTGLAHMSANDLSAADKSFQQAIHESNKLGSFEGKEVLYLVASESARIQGDFSGATKYLDLALSLNPEYARAYIGRGNIYYDQALQKSFDETLLNQALTEFKRSLEARDQPSAAYITYKANVSIGNVYVILAQKSEASNLFSQAIYHYELVVSQYERTNDVRLKYDASVAYFGLGAAYERQMDYAKAQNAYRRCIELTSSNDLRSRAENQINAIKKRN